MEHVRCDHAFGAKYNSCKYIQKKVQKNDFGSDHKAEAVT